MRATTFLSSAALLVASMVAAEDMQINYYSDQDCSSYVGQLGYDWAGDLTNGNSGSYNYQYGTSFNIAACYHTYCMCEFYEQPNMNGDYWTLIYDMGQDGNCIRNAPSFQSMSCYFHDTPSS